MVNKRPLLLLSFYMSIWLMISDDMLVISVVDRPPHGLHALTVLDDKTTEWLLNTCPEI